MRGYRTQFLREGECGNLSTGLGTQIGAGGPLGNGRQWFSWVHRDDAVSMIMEAIKDSTWQVPARPQ